MIRTVLSMVVRAGCEPEFEQTWSAAAAAISGQPGNLSQTLSRDAGERRRYVITSDWASAEALRSFESSAPRRALSAALESLRETASKNVLDVIATIPGHPGTGATAAATSTERSPS
jgi:heme-degrading monooxygenase HmoA